jgi:exocyst complex component 5
MWIRNSTHNCALPIVTSLCTPVNTPSPSWEALPDPDSPSPVRESGLASLYSAVRKTVGEEIKIVDAVFPNPSVVIQIFLQRIFAQSVCIKELIRPILNAPPLQIQQYLEQLLNKAAQLSSLSFLRMLKVSHAQTAALVDVLKSYDLSQIASRSSESNRASLSAGAAAQGSSVAISTMLDSSMDELFVPYMEGSRYLERETKCLAELYMLNLYPFSRWHVRIAP